jgi:TolB-like protein
VAHTRQPRIIVTARLASAQGSRSLWAPRFSKAQRY